MTEAKERNSVTPSAKLDRLVTWLLLVGGGTGIAVTRADPQVAVDKTMVEVRAWREDMTKQVNELRNSFVRLETQFAMPVVSDDRMRRLEDRVLDLERKKR